MLRVLCLAVVVAACACARDRRDLACEWTPDAHRSLQVDAIRAEDAAVRFADVTAGRRSGRRAGPLEYTRVRNMCLSALFRGVARVHGTSVDQVRAAADERPRMFDALVMLSFALVYVLVADGVARWIRARFAASPAAVAAVTSAAAAATALGGLVLGGVWSAAAEIVRLGNDHLSFRGFRIPWDHHLPGLFAAGVVLFLVVSIVQWFGDRARARAA